MPLNPLPPSDQPLTCDVLVVGGGINGAGIARDLAGRGAKVVLCEQHDLAHALLCAFPAILEQAHFRVATGQRTKGGRRLKIGGLSVATAGTGFPSAG